MTASARDTPGPGRPRRAVVIGGGLTAMLTARVLAKVTDVVIIERDVLPDRPKPRIGLPQAHHTHILWSGGAEAIEALIPGTAKELDAAGARRVPLTTGMVAYSPKGWFRRWGESHYAIACSRDLLDWVVRKRVLTDVDRRITVMERTTVTGLTGDSAAVTGVTVRARDTGEEDTLLADLVVDTSGKQSRTPLWLKDLGSHEPLTREVDSGLVYASRVYQAPEGLPDSWPIINVQADTRAGAPGRAGIIMPIEAGRWLVTLSGTRGGQPTDDAQDFQRFALGLRHPIVAELIGKATPLGPVRVTHMTANRRRFYEKVTLPDNFLVLGDAVAAFNPTYGHGMSVAAQSAVILDRVIQRHGWGTPGLARRVQRAVAQPVDTAWMFATGTDVFYPGATEEGPTLGERAAARFVDRLVLTATGSGTVARALTDVMTLQDEPKRLARPGIVVAALAGPLKPRLQGPPLTHEERQAIGTMSCLTLPSRARFSVLRGERHANQ
ncbi:FAD-dependent monooxygenase [Streptomyces sp. NPDC052051]|uniref:NAD(P)/FAD-dependent oxidoreductase n=1 Tax=Streptomyces sp. NPDC052051 TaxID=3154649 RepID=UPI00342B220E